MHSIQSIYLFIFIFTSLVVLRNIGKVLVALLQKNPKPLVYSNRELTFLGLSISYILTYLVLL
jgi:hypothetical protein